MKQFIVELAVWLSQTAEWFSKPIFNAAAAIHIFGVTSFLLGLVGATVPCQLTSNSSAIALVTRNLHNKSAWLQTGYFVLGKAMVYTSLGILALFFGITLKDIPWFNEILFRKITGPLLILIGFILLGAFNIRFGFLHQLFGKDVNG